MLLPIGLFALLIVLILIDVYAGHPISKPLHPRSINAPSTTSTYTNAPRIDWNAKILADQQAAERRKNIDLDPDL